MAKIVDPDQLNQGTEIVYDKTGLKTIQLLIAGNLDDNSPGATSGVALQAVYSFSKEEWRTDAVLNRFRFPILAIFEAKFIMRNGWDWADAQTRDLIRDAGWQEDNGDEYATIISLGSFDDDGADQGYYQQVAGFGQTPTNFDKTGRINSAIRIVDFGTFDYSGYLKVFLREQGKTFDQYNLLVEQNIAALTFQAYSLPLSNQTDIKIIYSDAQITTIQPFISMALQYYVGTLFETAAATTYVPGDVVQDGVGRWARCTTGGTVVTPTNPYATFGGTSVWEAYPGEKLIGTNYYAFNREIRCQAANRADREELYAYAQYRLRQSGDINDDPDVEGYGTVNGNIANPLCFFVGDTLYGEPGVWFEEFDPNITNDIVLQSIDAAAPGTDGLDSEDLPKSSTERTFPFVSAGTLVFNTVLQGDANAIYRMYFANAGGNLFDSANAIIVNDNSSTPISGNIGGAPSIAFDFDYDNNNQGGRTPGTDADVVIVCQGLDGAEWVEAAFTITQATGLTFPVNAAQERNYLNP